MGKYNDWTRGEGEALLNIVGGVDIARVVLRGERKLTVEKITKVVKKHDLFTTSEEQIRRLLDINEAVWHDTDITEEAIRELGDPPECPVSDEKGLYCVVLLYETGDVVKTFRRNWEACVHVRGEDSTWNWDGLLFTPQGVRPSSCWSALGCGRTRSAVPGPVGRGSPPSARRDHGYGAGVATRGSSQPEVGCVHEREGHPVRGRTRSRGDPWRQGWVRGRSVSLLRFRQWRVRAALLPY